MPQLATIQLACAASCECAKCSASKHGKHEDAEMEHKLRALGIQRDAAGGAPARVDPEAVQTRLAGGSVLPPQVTERFSNAYRHDLSDVRVHADSALPRDLGARAFAMGRHVAFAPGEFRPGTREGDRLIGHELAHVVQQAGSASAVQGMGLSTNGYEVEATAAADAALDGRVVPSLTPVHTGLLQRDDGVQASMPQPNKSEAPAPPKLLGAHPMPTGDTVTYQHMMLSTDREFVAHQLEGLWATRGEAAVTEFVEGFVSSPATDPARVHTNPDALEAWHTQDRMANADLVAEIIPVVEDELARLKFENETFFQSFQSTAEAKLLQILDASQSTVESERERYGFKRSLGTGGAEGAAAAPAPESDSPYSYSIEWNSQDSGLVAAAGKLAEARASAEHAKSRQIYDAGKALNAYKGFNLPWVDDAERKYLALRDDTYRRYPILAAFEKDPSALATMGQKGLSPETAALMQQQIREKLANIEKVRAALNNEFTIWDLPAIVDGTLRQMMVKPLSMHDKVVSEYRNRLEAKKSLKEFIVGTITFALGLLSAIPTGGTSLIATAALAGTAIMSVAQSLQSLQAYTLQSAQAGTDFDRALAISQEEPSLLWLAVQIAGTIADVGFAAHAFHTLAALRRAAILEKAGAAELLAKRGNEIAEGLGEKLVQDAVATRGTAAAREAGVVDRALVKEEESVLKATAGKRGSALTREELQTELSIVERTKGRPITEGPYVEEVELPNGHTWKRTKEGRLCRFSEIGDCFAGTGQSIAAAAGPKVQQGWFVNEAGEIVEHSALPAGAQPGDVVILERNGQQIRGTVVASDAGGIPGLEHVVGVKPKPDAEEYIKRFTEEMKKHPAGTPIGDKIRYNHYLQQRNLTTNLKSRILTQEEFAKILHEPPSGPPLRRAGEGVPKEVENLQWGNPESPAYGHSAKTHGSSLTTEQMANRARKRGGPQGQWADDAFIVEAERRCPLEQGEHIINMGKPVGRIILPNGQVIENISVVKMVRGADMQVISAFPFIN
ncbi:hypothetical protein A7982_12525 [Minicystis rosea]|nr:hypothetical protein A7982_12525 [Minicystis rosea]